MKTERCSVHSEQRKILHIKSLSQNLLWGVSTFNYGGFVQPPSKKSSYSGDISCMPRFQDGTGCGGWIVPFHPSNKTLARAKRRPGRKVRRDARPSDSP